MTGPGDIIAFWRDEVGPQRWFASDTALDRQIAARFEPRYRQARDGALDAWQESADGALALLLLLDQFPRNMYRGRAEAFATDALARRIADDALARGYDLLFASGLRAFFYLPLMHSENPVDQDRCVALVAQRLGRFSTNYPFALSHREEIRRFGRFPARNAALGRVTSEEESHFLVERERR